jgi:hypothetical protein
MKIVPGGKDKEYVLEFSDLQEFENFFEAVDREGSFTLLDQRIPHNSEFRAVAVGSPRSRKIRPQKIVSDHASTRVVLFEPEPEVVPLVEEKAEAKEEIRVPVKPLQQQLREMTVTEKSMLAMRANLAERRLLIQDPNPKVQEFLMRNPRLTESEIAHIAKNPMTAIPTLLKIIQHKEWMATDAIRQGILTNPKTPAQLILDRIPYLSGADLIKMHHARNLREDIREAVQRQMKKKGIVIRKDAL